MTAADLHAVPDEPTGTEFDNEPPHHLPSEQAVLGAMLMSPIAIGEVVEILRAEDFYQPRHADLFSVMVDMFGRGEPVDFVTVSSVLQDAGKLERLGGAAYLHTLWQNTPAAASATYYARKVAKTAFLRRTIQVGGQLVQLGYGAHTSGMLSPEDVLAQAEKWLAEAAATISTQGLLVSVPDLLPDAIDAIQANNTVKIEERPTIIPTGLVDLDDMLGGWRPGQLVLVAARPGMGKSVASTGFALTAAKLGYPVAMFSLEMTRLELMYRLLAAEARVPLKGIRDGGLDEDNWRKLSARAGDLSEIPLWLSEERDLTLNTLRGEAQRHKRRHGLGMLVVDYAQLVKPGRRVENRQQEVAAVARGLKELAGELEVPLIVPTQLNRDNEKRQDKRPVLSDLRESGDLEAAADVVILLHREDYYDDECPRAGEADFIIAKARDASTGTVTVAAQLHFSRFVSMAI
jgi:replicative DNA helicase